MNPRITKEFRALLLPWGIVAFGAGLLPLEALAHGPSLPQQLLRMGCAFATFVICAGLALLTALPFGAEFQQRTLPLLLAQPLNRSRLWNEKLLALLLSLFTAGLVAGLSWLLLYAVTAGSVTPRALWPDLVTSPSALLLPGMLLLATICSTGFWSMLTRSTLGGVGFSVMSQFFTAGITAFVLHKIYGDGLFLGNRVVEWVIVIVGLVYSATFLFLGWRKFAHLEVRDSVFGEGIQLSPTAGPLPWWSSWLICRPQGGVLNLVRKELRLQKPVLLVAIGICVAWVVAMGFNRLWPEQRYDHIIQAILCFYAPLQLVLAGCVSLGDEKSLGVASWQLTLPVSTRRLWFMKLSVASISGMAFGFILPCLLFWLSSSVDPTTHVRMGNPGEDWSIVPLLAWLAVLVGFWTATFVSNAVRGALGALAMLAVGGACVLGGGGVASELFPWGGLLLGLFTRIMTHFQLPPGCVINASSGMVMLVISLASILLFTVLLAQSLAQFRRTQTRPGTLVKYALPLFALLAGSAFWSMDCYSSAYGLYHSRPPKELENALSLHVAKQSAIETQTPQTANRSAETTLTVTASELEKETSLSLGTRTWVHNSVITYRRGKVSKGTQLYAAVLKFPNGKSYEFGFGIPTALR